jgi:hypothetical protein
MAGDEYGHGIGAASATDGAGGFGFADFCGDFGVTFCFAGRDLPEYGPDLALKIGAARQVERRKFAGFASGEGVVQGAGGEAVPLLDLQRRFRGGFLFWGRLAVGVGEIQLAEAEGGIVGEEVAGGGFNYELHGMIVCCHASRFLFVGSAVLALIVSEEWFGWLA